MQPPAYIATYQTTTWGTSASSKTVSVTAAPGDMLVIYGFTEDNNFTLSTPTGGGLTYTLRQTMVNLNYGTVYVWTAPNVSDQTFTMSVAYTESGGTNGFWGFGCQRWANCAGIGTTAQNHVTSGAPTLTFSTAQADSAIAVFNNDWSAVDGTSRVWRTGNGSLVETLYNFDSNDYTVYAGYHPDAGVAGSKTVGLTTPTGQKFSIAGVELLSTMPRGAMLNMLRPV